MARALELLSSEHTALCFDPGYDFDDPKRLAWLDLDQPREALGYITTGVYNFDRLANTIRLSAVKHPRSGFGHILYLALMLALRREDADHDRITPGDELSPDASAFWRKMHASPCCLTPDKPAQEATYTAHPEQVLRLGKQISASLDRGDAWLQARGGGYESFAEAASAGERLYNRAQEQAHARWEVSHPDWMRKHVHEPQAALWAS